MKTGKNRKYCAKLCAQKANAAQYAIKHTWSKDKYVAKANLKHQGKYDYSKTNYTTQRNFITIVCPQHGEFRQVASQHLLYGCKQCRDDKNRQDVNRLKWLAANSEKQQITYEDFIKRSVAMHKQKYDYSRVKYVNRNVSVEIICPTHGVFSQKPLYHMQGHGCRKCSNNSSNKEHAWLSSLNIYNRQVRLLLINGTTMIADGYDPLTKTVYEFWGDFWHGNPAKYSPADVNPVNKTLFGELHNQTLNKISLIIESGYKLVSIWESDYEPSVLPNTQQ